MQRNRTSLFVFFLMADAWVSEGAAVLMCIVLPANCVTPICPPSFPEWCEVCGSTQSSWSETILWTSKFTIGSIWWAAVCQDCTIFLQAVTVFISFSCQGSSHTSTHTSDQSHQDINSSSSCSSIPCDCLISPNLLTFIYYPFTLLRFPFAFSPNC